MSKILFSQGYICAIGGGSEDYNDWSDRPYSWIVEKSNFGRIVILSYSSATNWLPNYFISLGADTSYNIIISSRNQANTQEIYDEITSADGIFIKGGDQWQYIRLWKNTLTDSSIVEVYKKGGVISGTSAGAAILGSIDFSAKYGTVYSDEALETPYNNHMQFETAFINLIPNALFDTHFTERGRQGRLISMLYNLDSINNSLLGIGIDDRTAFCYENNGIGEVMGSGAVTFIYKDNNTKYFENKNFTTFENMNAQILTENWKYNLNKRQIEYIPETAKSFSKNENNSINPIMLLSETDFKDSVSFTLQNFFQDNNCKNILIFSHLGFQNNLNDLEKFLSDNNYNSNIIFIDKSTTNSNETFNLINNSDCFLFYGDSLSVIQEIAKPQNLSSIYFKAALQNNIPIILIGNTGKLISKNYYDFNLSDIYAAYYGRMFEQEGFNISPISYQPFIYANNNLVENRMCALLWNLMKGENNLGIALNKNDAIFIDYEKKTMSNFCKTPTMFINTNSTLFVDTSTYRRDKYPRQICAFDKIQISVNNNPNIVYDYKNNKFIENIIDDQNQKNVNNYSFQLEQNYPNPFNPITRIRYSISQNVKLHSYQHGYNIENPKQVRTKNIKLIIYDILGNELTTLINAQQTPGNYEVNFDGSKFSSGIYFYKVFFNDYSITKKMVLLK
ncbi:MAG: Type 1 glutamine amidotransferase-like domain-containing protein [Ignavibacteriales bacterium]|nr:Type 1 glutamine amidotransferase-like domain-containing protein [Ignavibacteriales bacterium]MCB9219272.1 Type 1 glutamine amidotransferase-like domain-containing protein [Ignavibacteriales bacterium]MCB9260158.1 Type 1 glutamine amidotransferase-like domain-containing protein [Ignavibacteriales bacterium]